jgi:uncharacterized integral membrane protein (TIGR00697 family)
MSNEWLFASSALVDIIFVSIAARLGREWIFGTIITNLILIGIFGAKLVSVFGIVTNVGNVFYACVFLATYFLIEKYGRRAGITAIQIGLCFIIFFVALSQIAARFGGFSGSSEVNGAIATLFSFAPRIILGSIVGYAFAQYANIRIYEWIKSRTNGRFLFLRANGANIISQLLDSSLFFSIAFFDLPGPILVQAIFLGWAAKVAIVALGTPFLYIDKHFNKNT